jgi:CRP/FNR family transcriptional regulator, cyclic AMP receptor protein
MKKAPTVLEILSRSAPLKTLPPSGLFSLAERSIDRRFAVGAVLVREGDLGGSLHVIVKGRVRVERAEAGSGSSVLLGELGPGEVVGELAVFDGGPRSATVSAIVPTVTLEIAGADVKATLEHYPSAAATFLTTATRRLRDVSTRAAKLTDKRPKQERFPLEKPPRAD